MAEIVTVYELAPEPRTTADILPDPDSPPPAATRRAKAQNKWLKASVTDDASTVIADMFNEADRRDPEHQLTWVALVDGSCRRRHEPSNANLAGMPTSVWNSL